MRPLAVDLCTGLHGWAEGLIAAGWRVVGIDIEDMCATLGEPLSPEHFELVIQDMLTVNGADYADVEPIVGSSPCTKYSYMAMPWTRSKALAAWYRDPEHPERLVELNALYDAQFRIQREASDAAGRHIPLVVENVRGAIPWVGRSRANFGSYHLWGDVPALMPEVRRGHGARLKTHAGEQWNKDRAGFTGTQGWNDGSKNGGGSWFNIGSPGQTVLNQNPVHDGRKIAGFRFDGSGGSFQTAAVDGMKSGGGIPHIRDGAPHTKHLTNPAEHVAEARKGAGAGAEWFDGNLCQLPSGSSRRKAASAKIAKIPFALAHWVGLAHLPGEGDAWSRMVGAGLHLKYEFGTPREPDRQASLFEGVE